MRINSKRKIILGIAIALLAILLFWLVLRFIVSRTELDEQFGDSGEWSDEDGLIDLVIGDTEYVSEDNIDSYLIIGTDAGGEDLGEKYSGTLADFIVLLLIDNTTERFAFIQIDRNSMTDIQTVDDTDNVEVMPEQQLCLSHWYGADETERNNNTVQTVSYLLGGLDIDNYFTISMTDMDKINNAIGGVVVDIEEDMTNVDPAFMKGASVHLTDGQAEKFVRARMDVGDGSNKARMARQTQYMQKAYNMVMGQLRDNPEYVNELYEQLSDIVESREEAGADISRITNHILQYENLGILQFSGSTKIADTQGDGIEHEEFYVDDSSIVSVLRKVMDLRVEND